MVAVPDMAQQNLGIQQWHHWLRKTSSELRVKVLASQPFSTEHEDICPDPEPPNPFSHAHSQVPCHAQTMFVLAPHMSFIRSRCSTLAPAKQDKGKCCVFLDNHSCRSGHRSRRPDTSTLQWHIAMNSLRSCSGSNQMENVGIREMSARNEGNAPAHVDRLEGVDDFPDVDERHGNRNCWRGLCRRRAAGAT